MTISQIRDYHFESLSNQRSLMHDLCDTLYSVAYVIMRIVQRIFSSSNALVNLLPLTCREIGDPNGKAITTIETGFFPGMTIRLPSDLSEEEEVIYIKEIDSFKTLSITARIHSSNTVEIKKIIATEQEEGIIQSIETFLCSVFIDRALEEGDLLRRHREVPSEELGISEDTNWSEYVITKASKTGKKIALPSRYTEDETSIEIEKIGEDFFEITKNEEENSKKYALSFFSTIGEPTEEDPYPAPIQEPKIISLEEGPIPSLFRRELPFEQEDVDFLLSDDFEK